MENPLLSGIMSPRPANQRPTALAAPKTGPSGKLHEGGRSRAARRARTADRTRKVGKMNAQQAKLQREREQRLETAAVLAHAYFAGPTQPTKQTRKTAYARVLERVEKQAQAMLDGGSVSTYEEAIEQIENSMAETIRQHNVLQNSKASAYKLASQ